MATALVLDLPQSASTDIATIVAQTPVVVLVDQKQREDLYAHIRREIDAFEPDLTTAKGRDAVKSLAFKITRTKTAIDAAGKQLNEEARAKINVVDAARRDARETLDALAEQVRKPLTDWEDAEKARVDRCREIIDALKADATVSLDDTADVVRARGKAVWLTALTAEEFGDMLPEAEAAKDATVATLKAALARLEREEADRAELERLRAEAAERDRLAAEKAAAEEAERQRIETERLAEERRVAAEKAEAERIATAERAAEDRARQEAEQRHAAELAAERERADAIERAAQEERDRVAKADQEREAQAERDRAAAQKIADEQAAREANKAHRTKVKTAAKRAIMTCGVSEDAAQKVVLAIIAGEIPAVSLEF